MNTEAIEYGIEDLPESGLSAIAESAAALRAAYVEKERIEAQLKAADAEILRIETVALPSAMKNLGVESWTLTGGDIITLKEEVSASISGPREGAAFEWLRATGNESLIKRAVIVSFGRGEDELANALVERLREQLPDNELVDKATVNANTLKAFVRERIALERELQPLPENPDKLVNENGEVFEKIPRETFGIFVQDRAKIKKPKDAKKG